MHTAGLVLFVVLASAVLDATPQATPPAQSAPAPAPAAPAAEKPRPSRAGSSESYTYEPTGRRDPFITLLGSGSDKGQVKKGEGAAGMTVAEITVRGVLQSRGALLAMVQGPDKKTYIVHPGDRLLDGLIKSINGQGLVIEQEVNDPLSVVKQREVRKLLRELEDAK